MKAHRETGNKAAEQANTMIGEQWRGQLARGQVPLITLLNRMLQNIKCVENCGVGEKQQVLVIPDLCPNSIRSSSGGADVPDLPTPREHLPTRLNEIRGI